MFDIILGMKSIATANYDFESLITGGYVYIDKTDMFWKLASNERDAIYFISRPRRFGKSLMLSTFKYLFQGRKDLFKGLKIETKKWDWSKTYPVVELNMSDYDKEGTREGFRIALKTELQERLEKASIPYRESEYVFEFMFNKSARAAIRQIREKGYADAYKGGKRPVTLIGVNFSAKKRNIDEPLIVCNF